MKYDFFCMKTLFMCSLFFLFDLVLSYENQANKFTFESLEMSSMRYSNMKNFAKNLADTKKLQITKSNLRSGYTNNKNFNAEGNTNSNNNDKGDDVLVGSIVRDSVSGELTFQKAYLEDITIQDSKKVLARARFNKSINKIGWSKLFVETFDNAAPEIISWAAGFLEGKLTAQQILEFYTNLIGEHEKESIYLNEVFRYYEQVEKFIRNKTNKQSLESLKDTKSLEYWISAAMTQAQSDGLLQGYNSVMQSKKMNLSQVYFINADGEVPELLSFFKYKSTNYRESNFSFREKTSEKKKEKELFSKEFLKETYGSDDPEIVWAKIMASSHCSAIIKLIKDESNNIKDILVGHTTWDSYSEMNRIFKKYSFSYTLYGTDKKKSEIVFSSYPGTLTSNDDFYVLNKKIVVLETTLEMLDKSVFKRNTPNSNTHVPNYIRISVANRLANSAKEWTEIFKMNNGGTYNSQWMIIDFDKFKNSIANPNKKYTIPNNSLFANIKTIDSNHDLNYFNKNLINTNSKSIPGNLNFDFYFKQTNNMVTSNNDFSEIFYLLEQMPGHIEIQDMTNHLFKEGFWGSYNRPYFDKVYKESGYFEMFRRYGNTYSYSQNPRAVLINREIGKVKSIEDMKSFMQMNTNPIDGDHMHAISPRYDLVKNPEVKRPSGGIDSKIVNSQLTNEATVLAISGPSYSNGVKPFSWADWRDEPHSGLPEVWNFGWNYFDDQFIKN